MKVKLTSSNLHQAKTDASLMMKTYAKNINANYWDVKVQKEFASNLKTYVFKEQQTAFTNKEMLEMTKVIRSCAKGDLQNLKLNSVWKSCRYNPTASKYLKRLFAFEVYSHLNPKLKTNQNQLLTQIQNYSNSKGSVKKLKQTFDKLSW